MKPTKAYNTLLVKGGREGESEQERKRGSSHLKLLQVVKSTHTTKHRNQGWKWAWWGVMGRVPLTRLQFLLLYVRVKYVVGRVGLDHGIH